MNSLEKRADREYKEWVKSFKFRKKRIRKEQNRNYSFLNGDLDREFIRKIKDPAS